MRYPGLDFGVFERFRCTILHFFTLFYMVITVRDRPATVVTVALLCYYSIYYVSGAARCVTAIYSVRSG